MGLLLLILQGIRLVVFADIILSWIQRDPSEFPRSLTHQLTRPLYAPFHALLPPEKTGGFDLSPIFVLVGLSFLRGALLGQ